MQWKISYYYTVQTNRNWGTETNLCLFFCRLLSLFPQQTLRISPYFSFDQLTKSLVSLPLQCVHDLQIFIYLFFLHFELFGKTIAWVTHSNRLYTWTQFCLKAPVFWNCTFLWIHYFSYKQKGESLFPTKNVFNDEMFSTSRSLSGKRLCEQKEDFICRQNGPPIVLPTWWVANGAQVQNSSTC